MSINVELSQMLMVEIEEQAQFGVFLVLFCRAVGMAFMPILPHNTIYRRLHNKYVEHAYSNNRNKPAQMKYNKSIDKCTT